METATAEMVNYRFCCRLCLTEDKESLLSVFEEKANEGEADGGRGGDLARKISNVVGVTICSNDKVTKMVCLRCVQQINCWASYKQKCAENQVKLSRCVHILNSSSSSDTIKEEPSDPREHVEAVMIDDDEPNVVKIEPEIELEYMEDRAPPSLTPNAPVVENGFDLEVLRGEGSQNSIDTCFTPQQRSTRTVNEDREKIVFAAGLRLQQRNATPQEIVLDSNGLTRIELSYIAKCKAMVTMFDTLTCACHNAVHKNLKRLFSHLRSLRIWFPIYTCYNCMITFTDRSTNMKHRSLCQRRRLQHLLRLSELRKNDDIKRRLYQIFKCVQCKFLFSFYEDYCDHVDSEHIGTGPPYCCSCDKVFDVLDDYKQHIHRSCMLDYYCDICFVIYSNADEFEAHCREIHDTSEGFLLLQDDNYQQRRNFTRGATSPPEDIDYVPSKKMRVNDCISQEESECSTLWNKSKPASCPACGKVYSNYHNMLRHLRTHDENEKTIPCRECGEKFRLHAELKQHCLQVHTDPTGSSREYVFSCPDCGDRFHNTNDWRRHKESHKTQKCSVCTKEFTFKTELEQHRSVHLNIKVYRDSKTHAYRSTMVSPSNVVVMCEICDKTFASKEELKEHKVVHESTKVQNGIKQDKSEDLSKKYTCTLCNKHYLGYGGLWDHNKKKHPGRQIAHDYPRKCKYCDKLLYTGGSWVIHKRMHERLIQQVQASTSRDDAAPKLQEASDEDNDAESYHTCKRCFKVFSSKYNLKNHMKSHGVNASPSRAQSKLTKLWCDICHQPCQGNIELLKHKEEHKKENMPLVENEDEFGERKVSRIFTCRVCDEDFPSKVLLKKHKESHQDQQKQQQQQQRVKYVYCRYCKISFSQKSTLAEHMLNEHEEILHVKPRKDRAAKFCCNFCTKVFDTAGALCSHQGWHKRTNVDKHWRTEKVINRKESKSDAETASTSSRFRCDRCGLTFGNDTALQIHILEKHRNVNATVVLPRCSTCSADFESSEAYEKHKQLHLIVEDKKKELKQFPCSYCNSAFSRSDTLNAHVKQHHNEYFLRQFKCHVCERIFEKQNALTVHLKVHERHKVTGIHPKPLPKGLSCSICQIVFQDSKQLRGHIFSAHPF